MDGMNGIRTHPRRCSRLFLRGFSVVVCVSIVLVLLFGVTPWAASDGTVVPPSSLSVSSPLQVRFESPRFAVAARPPGAPNLEYWANFCEKALDRLAPEYGKSAPTARKIEVKVCITDKGFEEESGRKAVSTAAVALMRPESEQQTIVLNVRVLAAVSQPEQFQVVGHEMVHVLLNGLQNDTDREVPLWLHEGLAQIVTEQSNESAAMRLAWTSVLKQWIPMSKLTASFPYEKPSAPLAYAQSASFTRYVATKSYCFGSPTSFFRTLLRYPEQARGILKDLGTPTKLTEFEANWHREMSAWYSWMLAISGSSLLWGAIVVLFLIAYIRKRRREKVVMRDWDAWEREDD
jgi:hypothetical protein